jgi:tetratricopeptide (TPR) repeat protein
MKNFSNALSDFDQAIEIDSCFAEAYYNRALIYSRDLTDYKQALLDYDKAIEFNPALVQAYYNRGSVYYFLGKMKKACEDWHKAYSLGDTKAKDLLDEFCK